MPPKKGACKYPAPTTGAPGTAGIIYKSPYDVPGNTDGQGGGGDSDGDSGTPAADSDTEPSAAGGPANESESPEVPEDGAAEGSVKAPAAAPESFFVKASGGDEKSDEDDDDDDDGKGAAPLAKPPAKPPQRKSSRVLGVPPPDPVGDVPGAKKGKVAKDGGESAQAGQDRVASELADEV